MKTIYRAAFTLNQHSSTDELMNRVSTLVWNWLLDEKRVKKLGQPMIQPPSSASTFTEQEVFPGWRVQTHRIDADDTRAWGFRLSHPDGEDGDLAWVTEATVATKEENTPRFTCSLSIVDRGNVIRPIRRRPSRPGIVTDVLEQIGGKSIYPLLTKPLDLSESDGDCEVLVKALLSDHRRHPLVFISMDNDTQQPLVDPLKLASHLAGLAHVVLARNSDVTWKLRSIIPNQLNCYDGAVRLYWPGLRFTDSPYQHPLWPPQIIGKFSDSHRATTEVTLQLLEAISHIASSKVSEQYVTWSQVLDLERRKAIAEAKQQALTESEASGRSNAWAQMLEDENHLQSERIRTLEAQLASQAEETERQRSIAESYRFALEQSGKDGGNDGQISSPQSLPPDSVACAMLNAERDHHEKLVFSLITRSEDKDSRFQAPEEVECAFNWLATTYWNARSGSQPCADLDKSVRELIPGWSYSGGQKKHSVGKHESWYQCKWNGKDYWIGEHLGCGTSKRPEETIRVAFAWDDEQKKVVIGFIGQHQRNSNT